MKPVIAIPEMGNDLFRKYMKRKYVRSLRRAGGEVRWLALDNIEKAVETACNCSGLLLPGGADIDPRRYGQIPSERCGKPNKLRDDAEFPILEAFLATGKPIFCICRGAQLLNVYFGGTLHQDIKELAKCSHSDFRTRSSGIHKVTVEPHSRLAEIWGTTREMVNSLHHQAVDKSGAGLIISAVSEDGFPEALEVPGHRFCHGVQWHPEHMSRKSAQQQKLFDAFVATCKEDGFAG